MIQMRTTPLWFLTLLLPVLLHAGCGDDVQGATVDLGAPDLAGPDLAMLPLEGAPCVNDADCGGPGPLLCQYKIADGCAATGHCVRIVVPTCKGFVELCGCGGGWVESEWGTSDKGKRAKFYRITAAGRRALKTETESWNLYVAAVAGVMQS